MTKKNTGGKVSLIALSGRIETDPSEIKNHPNTRLRACLSINTHGVAFACGSSTTMTRCQRRLQTCCHKSASMIDKRTPATWKKMRTSSGEAARPAGSTKPGCVSPPTYWISSAATDETGVRSSVRSAFTNKRRIIDLTVRLNQIHSPLRTEM